MEMKCERVTALTMRCSIARKWLCSITRLIICAGEHCQTNREIEQIFLLGSFVLKIFVLIMTYEWFIIIHKKFLCKLFYLSCCCCHRLSFFLTLLSILGPQSKILFSFFWKVGCKIIAQRLVCFFFWRRASSSVHSFFHCAMIYDI